MTAVRVLTALCIGLTLAGVAAAGWFLVARPGSGEPLAALMVADAPEVPMPPRPAVDSLATAASARDPFRASRAAAPVPFDPDRAADAPPPPPRPSLPPLTLVGVALGAEPAALVDGLPGTESTRVLRVGETVAGFTVRRIEDHRVLIAGPDTTWTLRVRGAQP
jgi:hypothetical protein